MLMRGQMSDFFMTIFWANWNKFGGKNSSQMKKQKKREAKTEGPMT
jgi:hypothetical protein